jgi:hypothetical protein
VAVAIPHIFGHEAWSRANASFIHPTEELPSDSIANKASGFTRSNKLSSNHHSTTSSGRL